MFFGHFHLCQGKTWHLRLCDIFSGLTEKLGVHVTAEVDPKTVIFMETSEVSPAFPLTENSTLKKKKRRISFTPRLIRFELYVL